MNKQTRESTDKLIADCFKELACRMPIEKITIKEITDLAGVIRPTFYHHFKDKYEVLESIIYQEVLEPAQPLIENGMYMEAVKLIFVSVEKEKEFFSHAVKLEGQNSFESIVSNCIKQVLLDVMGAHAKAKNAWMTPDNVAEFYARTMTLVVKGWLLSEVEMSAKEVGEVYQHIVNSSMQEIFEELMG